MALKKKKLRKKNPEQKIEKQLLWIVVFGVLLIIIFFAASSFFKNIRTFEHEGLTFTKLDYGNIPMYHYYYYYTNVKKQLVRYNLYLRIDPRENNVPVEGGKIVFPKGVTTYVSVNKTALEECYYSVLAVSNLASFLSGNGLNVKSASPDFWEAGRLRQEHVTCENRPNDVVVLIKEGNETKITIDKNCYIIEAAQCQILNATEKFQIQTILDAKNEDSISLS